MNPSQQMLGEDASGPNNRISSSPGGRNFGVRPTEDLESGQVEWASAKMAQDDVLDERLIQGAINVGSPAASLSQPSGLDPNPR